MSLPKRSILELADQFREMEEKYDLFQWKTADGLYYWDIFRYEVYMTILSKYGIYENVSLFISGKNPNIYFQIGRLIKYFPKFVWNELRLLTVLSKPKQYIFLFISRFKDDKGNPQDFLLNDIYQRLKKDSFVMDLFNGKSFNRRNVGQRYFLYKRDYYYLFSKNNRKSNWTSVSELINREFNLSIDWTSYLNNAMSKFIADYNFFYNLFKTIKPKYLFFQSQPKGLVKAAKDLGIITLDFQHGSENKAVILYSYPPGIRIYDVPTIPHYFLTLGHIWNDRIEFPSKKRTIGNTYFYVEKEHNVHQRNNVLVIANVFVHDFLKKSTHFLAENNPETIFYYKMHSNQQDQVDDTNNFFGDLKNVKVIYIEVNVKDLMQNCFALVLVQSSVAYQALQKGMKVFIFKEDFYEASYDLFDEPNVHLVENCVELDRMLKNEKTFSPEEPTIFFEPFCEEAFDELLNEIKNS